MYVPLSEADGLWQPPGKRKPALLGCHPAVVVPQAMHRRRLPGLTAAHRCPAPADPAWASPHSAFTPAHWPPVQPVTLTAQSLTEVTWLTEGAKAHVGWADRSAHHRHPSICRLHAAHTPAVAQPQPPAGERLVPVRFSNPIKQRSGPARACGHVIRTAASVFTRPAWHVCVQISLLFQGHRP